MGRRLDQRWGTTRFRARRLVPALASGSVSLLSIVAIHACTPDGPPKPNGELRFSPSAPVEGGQIAVTYSPATMLAGERTLVLRGHFRTRDNELYNGGLRNHRIATMVRQSNGDFTTGFTLPDSVVYAAFAVEDGQGRRIDADGGKLFELLLHGADGEPLYHALVQRAYDFAGRYWTTSLASIRRATQLYPDTLGGWGLLRFFERVALGSGGGDSLTTWHRQNFAAIHARYSEQRPLDPASVAAIQDYARTVADSAEVEFWTGRLLEEAPGTYASEQQRAMSTYLRWSEDRDAESALAAFEEYWPHARGRGTQMAEFALSVAIEGRDLVSVDRWTERMIEDDRRGQSFVANRLRRLPERRERSVELALETIPATLPLEAGEVELAAAEDRALGHTTPAYARYRVRAHAAALRRYSRVLEDAGRIEEALDAMVAAASASIDPGIFRRLAKLRMAHGDTAGAARDYAVVAADPGTSEGEADSLADLVGLRPETAGWKRLLDSAREAIHPRVLADTVGWTPQPSLVDDADGNRRSLSELLEGRPTVLVFWTRNCNYSVQEIPELVRLHRFVGRTDARILSIAVEDVPGPEMDEFIATQGITYPVYYDLRREATNAFGISGTPTHLVVDADGRVRFAYSELSEIPLQLAALAGMKGAVP
ncbi:MAG: TlpA family protein disulfide reductase [Gemmatimonadetes bacterium]|nr:TlpA family protein disulfide reductase [Gemmatimonadota bacterium]MYE15908.1 TlpA family protein disulfide reductase [Gemmatimonadota bacterium]